MGKKYELLHERIAALGITNCALIGCSLAPTYQQPFMPIPDHFKETGKWVPAKTAPASGNLTPGGKYFMIQTLNDLEENVIPANQDLKVPLPVIRKQVLWCKLPEPDFFPTQPRPI